MKLRPRNPLVAIARTKKAGRHKDKKKERNRRACRKSTHGRPREED